MNTRARTAVQAMKKAPMLDKAKEMEKVKKADMQGRRLTNAGKLPAPDRRQRKIALQQDVDKLRKKLRHEENVHRALERAFTRPLGALPRLPPYLPSHTLELLAEVAVLEEEVVRLEEQVVNFRQGLYQEAIYISSSSKKPVENAMDFYPNCFSSQTPKRIEQSKSHAQLPNSNALIGSNPSASMRWCPDADPNEPSCNRFTSGKWTPKKLVSEDRRGKENQSNVNSTRNNKKSLLKKGSGTSNPVPTDKRLSVKSECQAIDRERVEQSFHSAEDAASEGFSGPNKLSEDLLKCLMSIFSRRGSPKKTATEMEVSPSVLHSLESTEDKDSRDPYGICLEFGRRHIGPYKHFYAVEASSIDRNLLTGCSFLNRRLKVLLRKLASVELSGMSHQQKLAFWINIYNSCMMNAFLEQGIPSSPEMVVALMPKAMVNVGGYLLSAMTIEHFILRSPYHFQYNNPDGVKSNDIATRGIFGLDWSEPLVTFALSCGSWSSPAVRVYTASQVDKELDAAKRDYLQATIGISRSSKLAIPKLLDWYLHDFAKDVESLVDWICLQLPSEVRNEAVECLEMGRRNLVPQAVQVLPYDFSFRYLLAPIAASLSSST